MLPQRISEKKLEAFNVGTMAKRQLSKKEIEEQKKKDDEEAAAHVKLSDILTSCGIHLIARFLTLTGIQRICGNISRSSFSFLQGLGKGWYI